MTAAAWSEGEDQFISEASQHHFLDRHNRWLALHFLRPELIRPGCRYLDVGCGQGYLLEDAMTAFPALAPEGADAYLPDMTSFRERWPQAQVRRNPADAITGDDASYGAISALNVLEHLQNDGAALTEFARLLRPGGRLFLSVPAGPGLFDFYDELHHHYRRYDAAVLRDRVRNAGLRIVHLNYFGVFLYPAFYFVKKWNQAASPASLEKKKQAMRGQIYTSGHGKPLIGFLRVEFSLGLRITYPWGIRLYAAAEKPTD